MKIRQAIIILFFTVFIQNIYAEIIVKNSSLDNFTNLCVLINKRLELAKEVAAYKYKNNLHIEDKKRERIVINNSIFQATNEGLLPETIESFFKIQITLSKHIQEEWFKHWKSQGFPKNYRIVKLREEIRPKLNIIGNEIIKTIKIVVARKLDFNIQKKIINKTINVEFITTQQKDQLLQLILDIRQKNDLTRCFTLNLPII